MNTKHDSYFTLAYRYASGKKLTKRELVRLRQWYADHKETLRLQPDPALLRALLRAEQDKAAAWERFKARYGDVTDFT